MLASDAIPLSLGTDGASGVTGAVFGLHHITNRVWPGKDSDCRAALQVDGRYENAVMTRGRFPHTSRQLYLFDQSQLLRLFQSLSDRSVRGEAESGFQPLVCDPSAVFVGTGFLLSDNLLDGANDGRSAC
jgi:hypothetical protein